MNQPAGIGIKDTEIGKVGRALPDDQETMSGCRLTCNSRFIGMTGFLSTPPLGMGIEDT
jgi:hypothetical protein